MSGSARAALSLAAGYHLRARPLCDGRIQLEGFELRAVPFENDGEGHEEFLAGRFDSGEFSLANYCALKSRGAPYMAIPAFPNRKFRHSYIFVPQHSRLRDPAQLKGAKVGIPGWLNTCGLWVRGILGDEYGVEAKDIHWITARPHKLDLCLPAGTRIDLVPSERSLTERMLRGEFDAIIVPDFPEGEGWRRLLPDAKATEQDYFRRTGIFPTSHAITFHAAYLERHPAAAQQMFDACVAAKNLALRDDADATYSNFAWNRQVWEEQRAVLGADPWRCGIGGNEKALGALLRYAAEQGLLARPMTIGDLFLPFDEAH